MSLSNPDQKGGDKPGLHLWYILSISKIKTYIFNLARLVLVVVLLLLLEN